MKALNIFFDHCTPAALERVMSPSIAFSLDRKSKQCGFEVIDLSFDPQYPDYWRVAGYASRNDFNNRATPNEAATSRTLVCSVQKSD